MKAIILGASSVVIAVTAMAAPVGATGSFGAYISGNAGMSSSGYSKIGIVDGKIVFDALSVTCFKSNYAMGANIVVGDAQAPKQTQATLPSANTNNCNAGDVTNNPPANSKVTINGLCNEDAAKVKANISGDNVEVIVNATGPCEEDEDDTPTPVVVTVTPKDDDSKTVTPVSTTNPKGNGGESAPVTEMPETGISAAPIIGGGLATLSYAGALVARRIRRS